jgi:hypothetical protein
MAKIKRSTLESEEQGSGVTARPKTMRSELSASPIAEPGLSVDPDELGEQFLRDATEQGNSESLRSEPPELSIVDGAPSDDALVGPNFDPDHDVWEQTVDLTLQGDPDADPPTG